MADEKDESPTIPAWQRGQAEASPEVKDDTPEPKDDTSPAAAAQPSEAAAPEAQSAPTAQPDDNLSIARRFLDDDEVRSQPRDKKEAFLKAKGISPDDITTLLGSEPSSPTDTTTTTQPQQQSEDSTSSTDSNSASTSSLLPSSDRAPVVTYPEFLTKQPAPSPPLVTTARLLTALQAAVGVSALVAGSSRYIFTPMLEQLTASRHELHADTSTRLSDIVSLLEKTVSVVPATTTAHPHEPAAEDASDSDPSELFHRDMGTQTLLPVPSVADAPRPPAHDAHATRLSGLSRSLADIARGIRSQSDGLTDTKSLVDVLRDDLDALTYRNPLGGSPMDFSAPNGIGGKPDDHDEIRKVRDNIRRVKGVLLTTRSFPSR